MVWFGFLQEKNDPPCRRILTGGGVSHFYVENDPGVNILRESFLSVTPALAGLELITSRMLSESTTTTTVIL
jgi:hypothetical protein